MPIKIRPNPVIPDHEVLRKIGGGAYGEVWLARGVTGALRAVKVVWREDFEDARGFEREFEGILKFEPISRDHPALVNILHVGRSVEAGSKDAVFYYYVMELGDDVTNGQEINPIEYEPRTLRADTQQAVGVQWDTATCIDVGLRLSEALDHLHERGLAHRDVKPSNVIFVNGRAKLADIGLVALRGQRTFVGTEGFVPPEGPGSAQADVYSLGKVLYEIATGKDRLSFPELPDTIPSGVDRKRWLELNRIICDVCEPRISKRKISSASDLAEALRRMQRGKRRRQSGRAVWMTTLILAGFTGWAGWEMVKDTDWVKGRMPTEVVIPHQEALIKITSFPAGAEVFDENGTSLGTTPTGFFPVIVGAEYQYTVKLNGYRPHQLKGMVAESVIKEPQNLFAELQIFEPPKTGEQWSDHLGNVYQPVGDEHESSGFIRKRDWEIYAREMKRPKEAAEFLPFSENGSPMELALATASEAKGYCRWFQEAGMKAGRLTEEYEVVVNQESSFENPGLSERARRDGLRPFHLVVRQISYGEIVLKTDPPGVDVYMNLANDATKTSLVDSTDGAGFLSRPKVKPGNWQLYLVKEGYKPRTESITVKPGEKVSSSVTMEKNLGVVFGSPWKNSIDMEFAPIGQDLMASVWETRVRDYAAYVADARKTPPPKPEFEQTENDPVVNVSRDNAVDFCKWLTQKERKAERIAQTHVYRLPTDLEWSSMAGLQEEEGISPIWRDARKERVFPWGVAWLHGNDVVGNFADVTAALANGVEIDRTIPGYNDAYANTAPVGSFAPNSHGLYDISGNVQEWVEDDYSKLGKDPLGVLRGGGWNTYQSENLLTGSRNAVPPTYQDVMYGFRVVLAKVQPPKPE